MPAPIVQRRIPPKEIERDVETPISARAHVLQARHTGRSWENGWLWKMMDRERFSAIASGNYVSIA